MVKPSRPMTPGDQIAELRTRVDKLERKPEAKPARGAVDLAGLKDVRLLYRNPVEAPKDGQVFRWVEDLTIPVYKGYWAPGVKMITGYATDSGTGDLSVSTDLVDGGWDPERACSVDVTMLIDPAFTAVGAEVTASVTLDGDPFTLVVPDTAGIAFVPSPLATLQLVDGDAGPPSPAADTEIASRSWSVAAPHATSGSTVESVSWDFTSGTPHVEANISGVDTDAWTGSHAIHVIWRITYL